MPIQVDAYTVGGMASGMLARAGHLREVLEQTGELALTSVRWQPLDGGSDQPAGDLTIAIDDVLVAVTDDESAIPVHASWHALRIEVGPYVMEGELPTLPGYDPERALARPNGEFVAPARSSPRSRRQAIGARADRPAGAREPLRRRAGRGRHHARASSSRAPRCPTPARPRRPSEPRRRAAGDPSVTTPSLATDGRSRRTAS